MPKYKVMIARFPYGGAEESECVDWLVDTAVRISRDPRFEVVYYRINDTPITMTRNHVLHHALAEGVDILLMVDSDIAPDCEAKADSQAKPFWDTSIEFMLNHAGPCVVAAPYVGPPPIENIYVFHWTNNETFSANPDGSIVQYNRNQAAIMAGIQEVAALPTGLMLLDMRALAKIPPPYTYYEWEGDGPKCDVCGERKPGHQKEKGSTEDVTFTRDLALAGVKIYCNWDAWAGHVKRKICRKPRPYTTEAVAAKMTDAIVNRRVGGDRLIDVKPANAKMAAAVAKALAEVDVKTDDARRTAVTIPGHTEIRPGMYRSDNQDIPPEITERMFAAYPRVGPTMTGSTATPADTHSQAIDFNTGGPPFQMPPNAGGMSAAELFSFDPLNRPPAA